MLRTTVFVVGLALTAGCGKSSSQDSTQSSATGKTAGIELFGKKPVPPGDLVKVKADMTQEQVKALFPGIKPTPNSHGSPSLSLDSGYSNVEYAIVFYSDKNTVATIGVDVPKDLAAKLESAWGPPTSKDMWPTWVNKEDGYEASVRELGRTSQVAFKFTSAP